MNETSIERKVAGFVERHRLLSSGDVVVVGVSGGADSVCLLHVLVKCQSVLGVRLHVAHLNHQLRGDESEGDARYVSDLAGMLGIPAIVDRRDVAAYRANAKCSLEEAAREVRYRFLVQAAEDVGASRIAVGHTGDDNVETVLMHILRGAGVDGLCGLSPCLPVRGVLRGAPSGSGLGDLCLIRPLLSVTRRETADYCSDQKLDPRIDSSNLSPSSFRNRLRIHLLPVLRQYNPDIDQAVLRLAELAREDSAFIHERMSDLWHEVASKEDNAICLDSERTAELPIAMQRRLLRAAIAELAGDAKDIEAEHIEAARSLLTKPVGKKVFLPRGLVCRRTYDSLVITGLLPGAAGSDDQSEGVASCRLPPLRDGSVLQVPGETVLPGWRVIASIVPGPVAPPALDAIQDMGDGSQPDRPIAEFDLRMAGCDLTVRKRRPGDRFQPLGMDTPKKLQDFMVDAKIARPLRDRIPIVCCPQHIIWVVGWRIDDRVKVTGESPAVLRLEFVRQP